MNATAEAAAAPPEHRCAIRRPDDWHLHLRDGPMLNAVATLSAAHFARAIVMPNLNPPVASVAQARHYRTRILDALPTDTPFQPLMTLYLTDRTSPDDIRLAAAEPWIKACKLYPAGATTNSTSGVTAVRNIYPALQAMQDHALVLCLHGEDTAPAVDMFDREEVFLNKTLPDILSRFPTLKVVLEHCTTKQAVDTVMADTSGRLAATITPHHLLYSRTALFEGSRLRPHMFCLPVLKAEQHRQALLHAIATDDKGKFFLGTDSAPHPSRDKENAAIGCPAGVFSAANAIEFYAEAFDHMGALDKLEGFASLHGPRFYGMKPNEETITLVKRPKQIPHHLPVPALDTTVVPLRAGLATTWTVLDDN